MRAAPAVDWRFKRVPFDFGCHQSPRRDRIRNIMKDLTEARLQHLLHMSAFMWP